jgi:hypothetical protein
MQTLTLEDMKLAAKVSMVLLFVWAWSRRLSYSVNRPPKRGYIILKNVIGLIFLAAAIIMVSLGLVTGELIN